MTAAVSPEQRFANVLCEGSDKTVETMLRTQYDSFCRNWKILCAIPKDQEAWQTIQDTLWNQMKDQAVTLTREKYDNAMLQHAVKELFNTEEAGLLSEHFKCQGQCSEHASQDQIARIASLRSRFLEKSEEAINKAKADLSPFCENLVNVWTMLMLKEVNNYQGEKVAPQAMTAASSSAPPPPEPPVVV